MTGIDESFDAALLVGYHARAGTTAAVLDHTYTYKVFRVRVDDMIEAGEFALNAAVAGCFGVPVVFVSGDEAAVAEARELLPGSRASPSRRAALGRAPGCYRPRRPGSLLRDGAQRALRAASRPAALAWDERSLRVVFTRSDYCDAAAACPGVERVDARTIRMEQPAVPDHLHHVSRRAAAGGQGEVRASSAAARSRCDVCRPRRGSVDRRRARRRASGRRPVLKERRRVWCTVSPVRM